MTFVVYILRCCDGTLYTGSTNNLTKRLHAHNCLKNGAKYTAARRPVVLVYSENYESFSAARKREAAIKRLTREEKLRLGNVAKTIVGSLDSLAFNVEVQPPETYNLV
ncbi:MAG: GIY-YIG nuclease family protein [Candidatus Gracilibacteria bacterium]